MNVSWFSELVVNLAGSLTYALNKITGMCFYTKYVTIDPFYWQNLCVTSCRLTPTLLGFGSEPVLSVTSLMW